MPDLEFPTSTGTVPGYLRANLALALKRPDLREAMLGVIRELIDASEITSR